ncbi:MAG: DNA repair protein RadC [Verrucomicrobia bacterium]|nr:DNA repair protein RadC [Verrucomicrobiota bacterium]MCF7708968.1 DNA repair protein RadC [Verrucomicrobiota bacterium]
MYENSLLIKDMAADERPRERMTRLGAEALSNAELLAVLLRTGRRGVSAVQVANELLSRFKSLGQLSKASISELRKTGGIGRDKAIALKSAFTIAQRMAMEIHSIEPLLDSPEKVAGLLLSMNRAYTVECFQTVLLNTRKRLISVEKITQGIVDSSLVHPREVFRPAISANASTIILAHNHPSGDPTPSDADIQITRELIRAGRVLKIDVLDHIILGAPTEERPKGFVSLRELGCFYE